MELDELDLRELFEFGTKNTRSQSRSSGRRNANEVQPVRIRERSGIAVGRADPNLLDASSSIMAACAMTELDHIVVAAHTLGQGIAHVKAALGIELPYGGTHPRWSTHNHVLRLGDTAFLEVIAIDPSVPAPARPRLFQLDDPGLMAELRTAPRLLTWVVRTTHIVETFLASTRPLGAIEPVSRGDLRWLLTVPNDGTLVDGGMMPSLIQWSDGAPPISRMRDFGYTLERLEAEHPDPAAYRRDLASIGADRHVEIRAAAPESRARLIAHIRTPEGVRALH
ncbi:MAG TPA: VOC family protein [Kofleriaceae bacterium]|jgi:hypothetical protein|nr:VOC family protein [Kofleriaceae bacterium]